MLEKCALLLGYFTMIFAVTQLLEMMGVFDRGMGCCEKYSDLRSLKTAQLIQVLNHRGVDYRHVIERSELFATVTGSGELSEGELILSSSLPNDEDTLLNLHHFNSSDDFIMTYSYPSVWLIQTVFYEDDMERDWSLSEQWWSLLRTLQCNGIRTGQVNCTTSLSYCQRHNWLHGQPVLVLPYETDFISFQSFRDYANAQPHDVLAWLKARLMQRIHIIKSKHELRHDWLEYTSGRGRQTEKISVLLSADESLSTTSLPLFIPVLTVLFEQRVKFGLVAFGMAKSEMVLPDQDLAVFVITPESIHLYGSGAAECMMMSPVQQLLTVLAPSGSDMLDLAITAALLILSVQPCVVFGGLRVRMLSVTILSVKLAGAFLLYSFFVSYVIPEYEFHYLFDGLLPMWRYMMLTWLGDQVRANWLRYTTINYDTFLMTYILYLLLVFWYYRRWYRKQTAILARAWETLLEEDSDKAYFSKYTWESFGVHDFWVRPKISAAYQNNLEEKTYCPHSVPNGGSDGSFEDRIKLNCEICQKLLSFGCKVCVLPCQHLFHRGCLAKLLSTYEHCCPTCQWPAYLPHSLAENFSSDLPAEYS